MSEAHYLPVDTPGVGGHGWGAEAPRRASGHTPEGSNGTRRAEQRGAGAGSSREPAAGAHTHTPHSSAALTRCKAVCGSRPEQHTHTHTAGVRVQLTLNPIVCQRITLVCTRSHVYRGYHNRTEDHRGGGYPHSFAHLRARQRKLSAPKRRASLKRKDRASEEPRPRADTWMRPGDLHPEAIAG